jgi:CPA2 family monovalent cation:H+ antiporter-2
VIIVGYGVNGENLARVLQATRIAYTVVEMNRATVAQARRQGARVVVGDATRRFILERAGLRTARALVVAVSEPQATRQIVAQAHAMRPDLYILARTRYVSEVDALYRLGARLVIPEEFETSVEIFAQVLKEFGVPDNVIEQQVTIVRAGRYGMLRGRPTDASLRAEWLSILEAAVTQTFLLRAGSPACGRTIREIALRSRGGATIVAVTRRGRPVPNPSPDFRLESGDVLVLVGTHRQLDDTRAVLEPPEESGGAAAGP